MPRFERWLCGTPAGEGERRRARRRRRVRRCALFGELKLLFVCHLLNLHLSSMRGPVKDCAVASSCGAHLELTWIQPPPMLGFKVSSSTLKTEAVRAGLDCFFFLFFLSPLLQNVELKCNLPIVKGLLCKTGWDGRSILFF